MCAYTTSTFFGSVLRTITYTYGEPDWKDLLTAYDGIQLYYDGIGNLTSDGTWTYRWQAGRQLAGMDKPGVSITYLYDHNGLRTALCSVSITALYRTIAIEPKMLYTGCVESIRGTDTYERSAIPWENSSSSRLRTASCSI